jgi:hypothetical protein
VAHDWDTSTILVGILWHEAIVRLEGDDDIRSLAQVVMGSCLIAMDFEVYPEGGVGELPLSWHIALPSHL